MKIFKLFKEIQSIKDVLTLIFTQNIELNHKLTSMQTELDQIKTLTNPIYEEFEGEQGDIRIPKQIYDEMCDYLDEDDIDLMGVS
tara:strand:- start:460 stop:714 length:255 start_codon:yes stop_codon:yes gene_type:complete